MSCTRQTFLCAAVFISTIPSASPAAYEKGSTNYGILETYVAENSKFNSGCTNIEIEGSVDNFLTSASQAVGYDPAANNDDIKATIPKLFEGATSLNDGEKDKIFAIMSKEIFVSLDCATINPLISTDIPTLQKSILAKILTELGGSWSTKRMTIACFVSKVLLETKNTFPSAVASLSTAAEDEITRAIGVANTVQHPAITDTYGKSPSIDLVSTTYNAVIGNTDILNYVGSGGSGNPAKRCHVTCYIHSGFIIKLNPAAEGPNRKLVETHLIEVSGISEECTIPLLSDSYTLATSMKASNPALQTISDASIAVTIYSLYTSKTALDDNEWKQVCICISEKVLIASRFGSAINNLDSSLQGLQKSISACANAKITQSDRINTGLSAACGVYIIIKSLKTQCAAHDPNIDIRIMTEADMVASYADVTSVQSTIGKSETLPTDEMMLSAYDAIYWKLNTRRYIGTVLTSDPGKLCQVICLVFKKIYERLNTPLSGHLLEKMTEYILTNYEFSTDCTAVPNQEAIKTLADSLTATGKLLQGSSAWSVQVTAKKLFDDAKALSEEEKAMAYTIASSLAIEPPSCKAKASQLGVENNKAIRQTANSRMQSACGKDGCGDKSLQLNCEMYKRLKEIQNGLSGTVPSISVDSKVEISNYIMNHRTSLYARAARTASDTVPANQNISNVTYEELKKVIDDVKGRQWSKEFIGNDIVKHAIFVCHAEVLIAEYMAKQSSLRPKNDQPKGLPTTALVLIIICVLIILVGICAGVYIWKFSG